MELTVPQLKAQLKQKEIHRLYLFHGEEIFLQEQYLKRLSDLALGDGLALLNVVLFDEEHKDFDAFVAALESYPQMAERKLIVLKQTDFLTSPAYQKEMEQVLSDLPAYAVVVFVERDVSKVKKSLAKIIAQHGVITEFSAQKPSDLRAWVNQRFAAAGKRMRTDDMELLVELCERSLSRLATECDKLVAYAGDQQVIPREAIEKLVPVSAEYKIFTMADKLLDRQPAQAYRLLADFKQNKEQPTVIIGLIYAQLSALLMFRELGRENARPEQYLPPNRKFLARRYAVSAARQTPKKLRCAMKLCAQLDVDIKMGKIDGFAALELLMGHLLAA